MLSTLFKSKKLLESQDQSLKLENCIDPVVELREEDMLLVSGGLEGGGGGGGGYGGGSYSYNYS